MLINPFHRPDDRGVPVHPVCERFVRCCVTHTFLTPEFGALLNRRCSHLPLSRPQCSWWFRFRHALYQSSVRSHQLYRRTNASGASAYATRATAVAVPVAGLRLHRLSFYGNESRRRCRRCRRTRTRWTERIPTRNITIYSYFFIFSKKNQKKRASLKEVYWKNHSHFTVF